MAFPILAVAGAATGLLGGIMGGSSQAAQARAQNRAAQAQAKRQFERETKEWDIANATSFAQWQWDKARIEQLRFNERQAHADYDSYNAKLIAAAERNLAINSGALYDKYVTEEALRGTQVGMEYAYATNKLSAESGETLRQYLIGINNAALQSSANLSKLNADSQELLGSLALEEERDQLGWQLNEIAGLAKTAEARGYAIVRQGGGATAKRLAADAAMQLGRAYGELTLKAQDRNLKQSLMNQTMSNQAAKEVGQVALQMQDSAEKMQYTRQRYGEDYNLTKGQLEKLTIPGFAGANRQYQRELDALRLQTQQVFDQAAVPYREQKYFTPLEPIKGLRPEMVSPTAVSTPSTASIIGNSILGGFQGAMKGAVTNPNGGISFI